MNIISITVISILVVWLILTVFNQFSSKRWKIFILFDVFGLIPKWTFFAPNPGITDYHILYRERWQNGLYSHWKEIKMNDRDKNYYSALWNPEKRKNKAIFDMVIGLVEHASNYPDEPKILSISLPYLLVLNLINSQDLSTYTEATQFMVMQTHGYFNDREPELVAISAFHRL